MTAPTVGDGGRADRQTTPTRYRREQRNLRTLRDEVRAKLALIRKMRASDRYIDRDDARGPVCELIAVEWMFYRRTQAWLRQMVPVKNSHISPAAARGAK